MAKKHYVAVYNGAGGPISKQFTAADLRAARATVKKNARKWYDEQEDDLALDIGTSWTGIEEQLEEHGWDIQPSANSDDGEWTIHKFIGGSGRDDNPKSLTEQSGPFVSGTIVREKYEHPTSTRAKDRPLDGVVLGGHPLSATHAFVVWDNDVGTYVNHEDIVRVRGARREVLSEIKRLRKDYAQEITSTIGGSTFNPSRTAKSRSDFETGQRVIATTDGDEEKATVLDTGEDANGRFLFLRIVDGAGRAHRLELYRGRKGWEDARGRTVKVEHHNADLRPRARNTSRSATDQQTRAAANRLARGLSH